MYIYICIYIWWRFSLAVFQNQKYGASLHILSVHIVLTYRIYMLVAQLS